MAGSEQPSAISPSSWQQSNGRLWHDCVLMPVLLHYAGRMGRMPLGTISKIACSAGACTTTR